MSALAQQTPRTVEAARILVAEDQQDVIEALRLLLKAHGYSAEFVTSPADAIAALITSRFDALLMDMNYSRDTTSGAEGLELIGKVRALDDPPAMIVMTAWGSIPLAVEAMHRGACDFVQKPWENDQLLRVLENQVARHRQLRRVNRLEAIEEEEAAEIQRAFLPASPPRVEGCQIEVYHRSARAVGGDYYDFLQLEQGKLGICIADAIGKGVAAALLMSNLQALVRGKAAGFVSPEVLCRSLNESLRAHGAAGKFITFFYAALDPSSRGLTYSNAGHNPPVLISASGRITRLASDDGVLGLAGWHYRAKQISLSSGDRLVLFTDGVTEAMNAADEEFGEASLLDLLQQHRGLAAPHLKKRVIAEVLAHCDGRVSDDITLVLLAID